MLSVLHEAVEDKNNKSSSKTSLSASVPLNIPAQHPEPRGRTEIKPPILSIQCMNYPHQAGTATRTPPECPKPECHLERLSQILSGLLSIHGRQCLTKTSSVLSGKWIRTGIMALLRLRSEIFDRTDLETLLMTQLWDQEQVKMDLNSSETASAALRHQIILHCGILGRFWHTGPGSVWSVF